MKKLLVIACLLLGFAGLASAQKIDLEPGLYVIDGDQYIRIEHQRGQAVNNNVLGVHYSHYKYKGATAAVESTGEFLLVCDMDKKAAVITPRKFNIFVQWTTPVHLRMVKLEQNKKNRVLYVHEIQKFMGIVDYFREKTNFDWEQCADNAYRLTFNPKESGEYAIIGLLTTSEGFNPQYIWGFTQK